MVGAVCQSSLDAYDRISGHRSLQDTFLDSLLDCREVVLRNGTAEDTLLENIRNSQIAGGLELHQNVAVLSVTAGLLLVLSADLDLLLEGLSVCELRLIELDLDLVSVLQLGLDDIELLLADAVEQRLSVFGIVDHAKGLVLLEELGHTGSNLIVVTLGDRLIGHVGIRSVDLCHIVLDRSIALSYQSITGLGHIQLGKSADIACAELVNFHCFLAAHDKDLADLLVLLLIDIIKRCVGGHLTGDHLEEAVLTDKRIDQRLPDKCGKVGIGICGSGKSLTGRHILTDLLSLIR